jgi:7-keto-8-aminopelargonate synthetase-like enzyme
MVLCKCAFGIKSAFALCGGALAGTRFAPDFAFERAAGLPYNDLFRPANARRGHASLALLRAD